MINIIETLLSTISIRENMELRVKTSFAVVYLNILMIGYQFTYYYYLFVKPVIYTPNLTIKTFLHGHNVHSW